MGLRMLWRDSGKNQQGVGFVPFLDWLGQEYGKQIEEALAEGGQSSTEGVSQTPTAFNFGSEYAYANPSEGGVDQGIGGNSPPFDLNAAARAFGAGGLPPPPYSTDTGSSFSFGDFGEERFNRSQQREQAQEESPQEEKIGGIAKLFNDLQNPLTKFKEILTKLSDDTLKKVNNFFKSWDKHPPMRFATSLAPFGGEHGSSALATTSRLSPKIGGGLTSLGGALGGTAGKALTALGGVVGPIGTMIGIVAGATDAIKRMGQEALQSAFKFADFSAAMTAVKVQQQVRDIQLAKIHGEAQAGSAGQLAEAVSNLNLHLAPLEDAFANASNHVLTILTDLLSQVVRGVGEVTGIRDWIDSKNAEATFNVGLSEQADHFTRRTEQFSRRGPLHERERRRGVGG